MILDGDTNAARAVVQSLGSAGHTCWLAAASLRGPAFASRWVRRRLVYPDPLHDREAFVDWVVARRSDDAIDHVIPVTELSLVPLHGTRDRLPAQVVILPPTAALDTVLDKEAARRTAAALGIPTPPSRLLAAGSTIPDRADSLVPAGAAAAWPVVVKPVSSKVWVGKRGTSLHVRLAHDVEELEHHLRYLLPLVAVQLQAWVPGVGVGIEALVRHGDIVLEFAHERLHEYPLTGGASTYRRTWRPPQPVRDAASRLLAELAWHGVAMVEFRIDPASGRYWLMEVNGRFWGSLPLALFAGVDFPAALIDVWRGAALTVPPPRRRIVAARQISGEIQWWKAVLRGRRQGAPRAPSMARAAIEWLRVFSGREVWDGARLSDPLPLFHEIVSSVWGETRAALGKLRRAGRVLAARRGARAGLDQVSGARRVLVLCHGNICRSPYAAARLADGGSGIGLEVRSAGTRARDGREPPELFGRLAAARGVDLAAHRSRGVDREALEWADLVVVMDASNRATLAGLDPDRARVALGLGALDPRGGADVPDPYRLSAEETALVLEKIDRAVEVLLEALEARRR